MILCSAFEYEPVTFPLFSLRSKVDATLGMEELSEENGGSEELKGDSEERMGSPSSDETNSELELVSEGSAEEEIGSSEEDESTASSEEDSIVSSEEGVISESAEETAGAALQEKSESTARTNTLHTVFFIPTNYTPFL